MKLIVTMLVHADARWILWYPPRIC